MKNALFKDFIREIRGNKGRFLSIFFIVLLGAAFFAGIRSTGGQMKYSADVYYDNTDMMDIRVLSTLGLTDDDLDALCKVEGVELVRGGKTKEALISSGSDQYAIRLIAATEDINKMNLKQGRMPEADDECVVDAYLLETLQLGMGDRIRLQKDTDETLSEDLTETEFIIVGEGSLPYYMDLTRGVGTIGDGKLAGFICVRPEIFTTDIYTEAYIRIAEAEALNCYSQEYKDLSAEVVSRIEKVGETERQRRYDELYAEGKEQIDDGKKQIEDAQKELDDAKAELDDGKKELDDAKAELDDGKEQLKDAEKELKEGEKELKDAEQELAEGKEELDSAKSELESGEKELADAKNQLDAAGAQVDAGQAELNAAAAELDSAKQQLADGEAQLADGKKQLDEAAAQLDAAEKELADGKAQLEENEALLAEKRAELDDGWKQYEEGEKELQEQIENFERYSALYDTVYAQYLEFRQKIEDSPAAERWKAILEYADTIFQQFREMLEDGNAQIADAESMLASVKAQLEEGEAAIADGRAQLDAAKAQLEAGEAEYEAGMRDYNDGVQEYEKHLAEYEAGKAQYEAGLAEYEAGKAQLEEGRAQYEAGLAQYQAGLAEYENGKAQYEEGLAEYESGKAQYEKGAAQLEEGKAQYEDAVREYEEGLAQYNDGLKEWEEGNEEYQKAYADAMAEINDAKIELSNAEKELAKLGVPTWYVLDREKISSCVSYGMDAERMDSLGNVFPVIFFLVAALVSLTAMTRMVEEQRGQIGTLKALGFSGGKIAGKYLSYAMLATLTGALIGIFIGERFLPWVIISSYQTLYIGLPEFYLPVNWVQGGMAIVLSAACTGIATLSACYRKLREKPAELMRPEAPKGGRRILLERMTFIWKRMNFTQKSTLRNLFRYKKRFIMTIIGIGGCMGLMLVGFGLRDSITVVAQRQYVEIFMQDASVSVDTDAKPEDKQSLEEAIAAYPGMKEQMDAYEMSVTLNANHTDRTAYLYVPAETDKVFDYVRFRDRVTKESYAYPKNGVALAEKTADMLGVGIGDTITIQKGENEKPVEVAVETIVENYVLHYAFMTPETYERLFGEPPAYNFIYIKYDDNSPENEKEMGTVLMQEKACTGIALVTELEQEIVDMMSVLNLVIWVLILAAAMLAFVVLYNLNSINMTERKRELATLKVLGFRDTEVAMYVYRENIILTIIGIAAGAVLGTILHLFTILTVEVDLMMFGRVVGPESYVICAVLTFAFSLAVNLVMYYHFKKIDMVESLKSVE